MFHGKTAYSFSSGHFQDLDGTAVLRIQCNGSDARGIRGEDWCKKTASAGEIPRCSGSKVVDPDNRIISVLPPGIRLQLRPDDIIISGGNGFILCRSYRHDLFFSSGFPFYPYNPVRIIHAFFFCNNDRIIQKYRMKVKRVILLSFFVIGVKLV